jgi:hypothetical protein
MAKATLALNGIDLGKWTVARGTFYRPPVSTRRTVVQVGRRHGVAPVGLPVFDEPKVTLELAPRVQSGDDDELEALDSELLGLLASPTLLLRRTVGSSVHEADAVLESATPSADTFRFGHTSRWSVSLAIPGVFLRGLTAQTVTASGFDWGTAPVADAVARFAPGTVDPFIRDETSKTGVSWAGTVPSDRYLFIDSATLRAWTSTSATAWDWVSSADVSSMVDYPAPSPLQLWPSVVPVPALYPSLTLFPSTTLNPTPEGSTSRSVQVTGSTGWALHGRSAWL